MPGNATKAGGLANYLEFLSGALGELIRLSRCSYGDQQLLLGNEPYHLAGCRVEIVSSLSVSTACQQYPVLTLGSFSIGLDCVASLDD